MEEDKHINIQGARVHNLKNINLKIPRNKFVVITGVSGSGKSSLAFDTIYAEGQRRYMETFSAYVRQFIGSIERPDVDKINGLSPVIAIEQKTTSKSPRSTVGTITEVYDFLRLLFSRIGIAFSYNTNKKMISYTNDQIIGIIKSEYLNQKIYILSPIIKSRKGHYRELFENLTQQGFNKVRVDGKIIDLIPGLKVDRYKIHDIELLIDRLTILDSNSSSDRLKESIKTAMYHGKESILIYNPEKNHLKFFSRELMCPDTGISYRKPEPNNFSFNSPKGMCKFCKGLGYKNIVNVEKIIPNENLTINNGGIIPLGQKNNSWAFKQIKTISEKYNFSLDEPIKNIPKNALNVILFGGNEKFSIKSKSLGVTRRYEIDYEGIINFIEDQYQNSDSQNIKRWAFEFMEQKPCTNCKGSRLNRESLCFIINNKNIEELSKLDIDDLYKWFNRLNDNLSDTELKIANEIIKEIKNRLKFLLDVGLNYLSMSRPSKSLSGGECQRIR